MNPNVTKSTHKNNFTFELDPPEHSASPSSQEQKYRCKKNGTIAIIPWDINSASKILYLQAFLNQSLCIQSISINLPKPFLNHFGSAVICFASIHRQVAFLLLLQKTESKAGFPQLHTHWAEEKEAWGSTVETQPNCMDVNQTSIVTLATLFHVLWTFRTYFGILLLHFHVGKKPGRRRERKWLFLLWDLVGFCGCRWNLNKRKRAPNHALHALQTSLLTFNITGLKTRLFRPGRRGWELPRFSLCLEEEGGEGGQYPPTALTLDPCVATNCCCHLI